jgi:aminoglycoside phosphotransferase (APT) family kinase protein
MTAVPPTRLHADEVAIDLDLARRLVTEQVPELAGLPLARVASGGTENAVFRLGEHHALRMPLTPGAVGGLLKEVRWLPVVSPHLTLEVPEVVATGEPASGYPFPWAVVRWLDGHDALTSPPESLVDTARAMAGFVSELRSIDVSRGPAPAPRGSSAACLSLVATTPSVQPWPAATASSTWREPAGSGTTP